MIYQFSWLEGFFKFLSNSRDCTWTSQVWPFKWIVTRIRWSTDTTVLGYNLQIPEHSRKPLSSSSFPSTFYYALLTSQLNFCFYIRSHDGKKHCNRAFKTKPIEQYFSMVLFIMLYTVVLRLCPCMESWKVAIQMRATEPYFLVFH